MDIEAKSFELACGLALDRYSVAFFLVMEAKVLVFGAAGEHVVDDVADFVTDGDNGSLFPFSPGETTIFPTQVGFLGMTSGPGCLGKGALKPGVALTHAGRFSLAATGLVVYGSPDPHLSTSPVVELEVLLGPWEEGFVAGLVVLAQKRFVLR